MDKVFGIIYPDVVFPDAPTCPHLHPHLGSSGPVKQNPWERWIMDRNGRRSTLDEPTDLSPQICAVSLRGFGHD